jgi:hypothetical protein
MDTESFSRRSFLRTAAGVPIGAVAAVGLELIDEPFTEAVASVTHHPVGNAAIYEQVNEACPPASEQQPDDCLTQYIKRKQIDTVIKAPLVEELLFRIGPSAAADWAAGDGDEAVANIVRGTENFAFTRRDLVMGIVSTIAFGATHNITDKGFDTNTIPANQLLGGAILWCLQRKFGFLSNTTAHAAYNYFVMKRAV